MAQTYSNPASRNVQVSADAQGPNIPGKVNVPFPQMANTAPKSGASAVSAPMGFQGGLIPGKI